MNQQTPFNSTRAPKMSDAFPQAVIASPYIFISGTPGFDPATNQPIVAKNVIVVAAEHILTDIVEDSLGTKGVDIKLNAFGDLRVFRDGKVYEGTWRGSQDVPPKWLGAGEVPINLKPGQSWVQVVQKIPDITYQ